ncbi:hypothetical protein NA256_19355 [Salmonella sp. NW805]|uniref:hypothetical protein n=1 Tax=unclassified Salmonella TaxID=2614656 RepID=UPI0012C9CC02|nr:hypothetical protein [Salmonella enterica]EBR0185285.1 hypothetical protein [Salmonella enterica subsp. enterica serovar Newport]EEV5085271.1 hypothetical protein [Salmonella enterica subsp. enterica serovar Kentucky]EBL6374142.1 hypothetical protein [Salmonella enterica]EBN0330335.1 hypothetical protein [Salmonella enterica]
MKNLNTKIQRFGFVILVLGGGLFLLGWFFLAMHDVVYAWKALIRSVTFDTYYWYGYNYLIAIGFYLLIIGLALSYFYDAGIGRVVKWIQTGNR